MEELRNKEILFEFVGLLILMKVEFWELYYREVRIRELINFNYLVLEF